MPAAPKPITAAVERRWIELVVAGASYAEASRAVQIGERSGDRIAARYKDQLRAARSGRPADPVLAAREAVRELLESPSAEVRDAVQLVRA